MHENLEANVRKYSNRAFLRDLVVFLRDVSLCRQIDDTKFLLVYPPGLASVILSVPLPDINAKGRGKLPNDDVRCPGGLWSPFRG